MIVKYLGFNPSEAQEKLDATRDECALFAYMEELYKYHMVATMKAKGDVEQVLFHIQCALRSYFLYLVSTIIFVDKSATYVDVFYLTYFTDLE